MAPELSHPKLVDQPWLSEFLSGKGFNRTSPTSFGNGRATLEFDGFTLVAIPGDGTKSWRSDLKEVPGEAILGMLDTFLNAPSFLPQEELDRRAGRQHAAEQSLQTITRNIRDFPETHSGQQLRRFLWSLYNGYHVLNLWKLKGVLDGQNNRAVTEVLSAWMEGQVPESSLRRALTDSGEMARWDSVRLTAPEQRRVDEAREAVNSVLRSTPPGNPQTHLAKADGLLEEVLDHLRKTGESGK
jgi:hypothetical protein